MAKKKSGSAGKPTKKEDDRQTLVVSEELHRQVKAMAAMKGMPLSQLVHDILTAGLEAENWPSLMEGDS